MKTNHGVAIVSLLFLKFVMGAFATQPDFECAISSDRDTYRVGEVPVIKVRITNKSDKEVVLVGALEGSAMGWRSPRCNLELLTAAGKPVSPLPTGCAVLKSLGVTDFVAVPRGSEFDPFAKGFFPPPQITPFFFPIRKPGTYIIRFQYTTSNRIQDYLGSERIRGQNSVTPDIQRLFARVPKIDIKSNELKLRFTPKP